MPGLKAGCKYDASVPQSGSTCPSLEVRAPSLEARPQRLGDVTQRLGDFPQRLGDVPAVWEAHPRGPRGPWAPWVPLGPLGLGLLGPPGPEPLGPGGCRQAADFWFGRVVESLGPRAPCPKLLSCVAGGPL